MNRDNFFTSFLKAAIWCATAFALFTPFIVENKAFFPFVGAKSIYFMLCAEIALAAWLILAIFHEKYRPKMNYLTMMIILFLTIITASTIFGLDPIRAFWSKFERMTGLLMFFHTFGFYLALSNTFKTKEQWYKVFSLSVGLSTIMSLYFLLQSQLGINVMSEKLVYSTWGGMTLGNSSFLATYLMFNVFLALYLISEFVNKKTEKLINFFNFSGNSLWMIVGSITIGLLYFVFLNNTGIVTWLFLLAGIVLLILSSWKELVYSILSFLILFTGLYFSGGRAALFAFFGGLAVIGVLYLVKKFKWGKIALAVFLISSMWFVYSITQTGTYINKEFAESGGAARLAIWENVLPVVWDKPLLGYGMESFELVFYKSFNPQLYLVEHGGEVWFDKAHNIAVDTLVSVGILGFLSYLSLFFAVFYVLYKKQKAKGEYFWVFAMMSAALASYFVQNLTVFDMVSSLMMFFLVLAFVSFVSDHDDMVKEKNEEEVIGTIHVMGTMFVVFMLFVWMNYFVFIPFKSDFAAVKAMQETDTEKRIELYEESMESNIGVYQHVDYLSQNITAVMRNTTLTKEQKDLYRVEADYFIGKFKEILEYAPTDYRLVVRLVYLLNEYARAYDPLAIVEAENMAKKTIELSPTNPQSYWCLAEVYLTQGKTKEALEQIQKSIDLEPRLAKTYKIGMHYAQLNKNIELVNEYAEKGLEVSLEYMYWDKYEHWSPGYDDAIYFAGVLGEKEKLVEIINRAIIFVPENKESYEKLLGEIGGVE